MGPLYLLSSGQGPGLDVAAADGAGKTQPGALWPALHMRLAGQKPSPGDWPQLVSRLTGLPHCGLWGPRGASLWPPPSLVHVGHGVTGYFVTLYFAHQVGFGQG